MFAYAALVGSCPRGRRKDFSRVEMADFPGGGQKHFPGGPTVIKNSFYNLETKRKKFCVESYKENNKF